MCVVNICRNLLALGITISNKQNARQLAAANEFLTLRQGVKEGLHGDIFVLMCKKFGRISEFGKLHLLQSFFAGFELLALESLAAAPITQLHELPRELFEAAAGVGLYRDRRRRTARHQRQRRQ